MIKKIFQNYFYFLLVIIIVSGSSILFVAPSSAQVCTDNDGDGFFIEGQANCGTPVDCDDYDSNVHPGAARICDGKDSNCDGRLDSKNDVDNDGDGIPKCLQDCNDNDPNNYPGNIENCTDKRDNDCDNQTDAADFDCSDCIDYDGDGYGANGDASCRKSGIDCNDSSPVVYPGANDSNCDSVDNDCDGTPDDDYIETITTCGSGECASTGQLECQNGTEVDTCMPGTEGLLVDPACGSSMNNHAILSWNPPTMNSNGTPLTDLAGYKIYYGTATRVYPYNIDVGSITSYQFNNLIDGLTYHFAITAYDTSGNESVFSHEVTKTVQSENIPPYADPTAAGSYTAYAGQSITLDGSNSYDSDGSIILYEWDIDNDGTFEYTSISPIQQHLYPQQGIYTVKLRVKDNLGAIDEKTTISEILDTSPIADFTGFPTYGIQPLTITFTNNSTGYAEPITYTWDLDNDGITDSTNQNPVFIYPVQGKYTVKLTVTDVDGNTDTLTKTEYINVISSSLNEYNFTCTDGGNIECLDRTDGGSDSDNLSGGKPKVDLEYEFKTTIQDVSGIAPQYVKLYMTQITSPLQTDFYSYDMACNGSYVTGAECTYITKLGPAAIHTFYFEAKMSDGTILRYPYSGYITGPEVQLLSGMNIVGIPRDISSDILDGNMGFNSAFTYRWDADLVSFSDVTLSEPLRVGEGYKIIKSANTLLELETYGELQENEFAYELKTGWNIISNPYSGNINLSEITVRKGIDIPISWSDAIANDWLQDTIHSYTGKDWGDTYNYETAPDARLIPWIGYWVYLNMTDDTYSLVIPKPR
jgi:PKD repeat protein